jgi:hypothetical protein
MDVGNFFFLYYKSELTDKDVSLHSDSVTTFMSVNTA